MRVKATNIASAAGVSLLALSLSLSSAFAENPMPAPNSTASTPISRAAVDETTNSHSEVQALVNDAIPIVTKMESDEHLANLMKKAKGLFIVPSFGRGAFIVGGRGGSGFVIVKEGNSWSDPAFYDVGGLSVGAQVGASGGSVVFLLMNQNAVNAFKNRNKFSLNAGADLSIVDYSATSQDSWGKGDVILWTNTAGAYAGARVSITDITWANGNNRAFYGKQVNLTNVLDKRVQNTGAEQLKQALPA